ncbi:hypothetical protein [Streptomyces sp. cg36]|uniref:hypothetical protein n=1 Tax=Streptomyces sp. cg36 TaxID=3238798 RepID=UPI0034E2FAE1
MRRRAVLIGVSATAALALGACGGSAGRPYIAVGGPESAPATAAPPHGKVALIPLDGSGTPGPPGPPRTGPSASGAPRPEASAPGDGRTSTGSGPTRGPDAGPTPSRPGGGATAPATPSGPADPSRPSPPTAPPAPGRPSEPPKPAALGVGAPVRAPAGDRWCEKVTVPLRNTGGTAVAGGTLTFATHVIGLLGVDWATLVSTRPLPAPLAAGASASPTYTICVDSWRVPLGMHIETRSVTADWR